ncbi:MAG: FAD binding domain-containing protein [Chloroflexota bacterium]
MSNPRHDHQGHDMTNSHLLADGFEYYEPATLDEAIGVLSRYGQRARVLAGGTFLLVQMKMEQQAPDCLVNVGRLAGLAEVRSVDGHVEIGALASIWDLRNSAAVQGDCTALAEACAAFGSTQIQLTGTIGGNVCNGSPASDTVPALAALGAELVLVGPDGERTLPIERFLVGPGDTAIRDGELLTAIHVPKPEPGAGSAFVKISRVRADLAKASAAARIVRDGECIVDCRLTFGSVGPTVIRACTAEQMLIGQTFSAELALAAGRVAAEEVAPIDDVRSSAWYRREVVKALTHDVLQAAWGRAARGRAGGEGARGAEAQGREGDREAGRGGDGERGRRGDERSTLHVSRDTHHAIALTVNGVERHLSVRSNELLVNVLRERLDLTGTKYGCGIGECGACTVLLDGVPALSCLTLAVAADGCEVTTVEGLQGRGGELDALQEAFIEHAAFQCGYCTPGMLMMTKRLLEENPRPSEEDIRDYLKGNRCRCTGFAAIVRAVESCVEQ